jgi:cyanosortase A-associated protein
MRYLSANGEVKTYIDRYTSIPTDPTISKINSGFYGMVTHDETAYISACIPPRGNSTFTAQQFQQNALLHDIRPTRVIKWWLGQQKLVDQRCLWTHLSIPIDDGSAEDAYDVLEEAWTPWLKWWQSHFPEL